MTKNHINDILVIDKNSFSVPWTKSMFMEELNDYNKFYYVIKYDNINVGYIGFWHILDEAHITNVCIDPMYRKKGLASILLNEVIKKCINIDIMSITLEVRESNESAIKLYSKFGFKDEGKRKNFYKNPKEDALIMWKRIKGDKIVEKA